MGGGSSVGAILLHAELTLVTGNNYMANDGAVANVVGGGLVSAHEFIVNPNSYTDSVNFFKHLGMGLISPVTNLIHDFEASPPPSIWHIIQDTCMCVVFVVAVAASGGGAALELAGVADVEIIAAEGAEEAMTVGSLFSETTTAVKCVSGALGLGAQFAQNNPIDPNNPLKSFGNASFQMLNVFTGCYGSCEAQIATSCLVLATGPPEQATPAAYLLAVAGGVGANGGSRSTILRRDLTKQELTVLKYAGTTVNVTYLANQGDSNPADYVAAIANSVGGSSTNLAVGNVIAEFAPPTSPNAPATDSTNVTCHTFAEGSTCNMPVGTVSSAQYGSGDNLWDVTNTIITLANNGMLNFVVGNTIFNGDPCPGVGKTLWINCTIPNNISVMLQDGSFSCSIVTESNARFVEGYYYTAEGQVCGSSQGTIISAKYGVRGGVEVDVSALVKAQLRGGASFQVSNNTMGGDPAPGIGKTLTIHSIKPPAHSFGEGSNCSLPLNYMGKAMYGTGANMVDVTRIVRHLGVINNGQINMTVSNSTLGGDPAPGIGKVLTITESIPIVADFFNEGYTRPGLFCSNNGTWHIKGSKGAPDDVFQCGTAGDIPMVADIFNEGKNRCIVFRPSEGNWYCKGFGKADWGNSTDNVAFQSGCNEDVPMVDNIFGDGNRAIVFRPSSGNWYVKGLGRGGWGCPASVSFQCGCASDIPLTGNVFGDGVRAIVYRPSEGNWYCKGVGGGNYGSGGEVTFQCGGQFDQPFIANILGDGPRCCVFRRSEGNIYVKSRGTANWSASQSTFGVVPQQTIKLNFPASAGDWTHDQAFLFSPSPASGQKGHIHPMIYRGSEQAFYVCRQSGLQVPVISPTRVNTMLKGTTPASTVLSTGHCSLLRHRIYESSTSYIVPPIPVYFIYPLISRTPFISLTGVVTFQWGQVGDIPISGDFFNEGICRVGIYRPNGGQWWIRGCPGGINNGNDIEFQCGTVGDYPLVGDVFNEGKNRCITYRPSTGQWCCKGFGTSDWGSSTDNVVFQSGCAEDVPLLGNIFGDGVRAINFRPSSGMWFIKGLGRNDWGNSTNSQFQCGQSGDVPLVGTMIGDGVRACVFRPSNGVWYCKAAGKNNWGGTPAPPAGSCLPQYADVQFQSGTSGDCPIISNVLGHGNRAVVLRPSSMNWFFKSKGSNSWSSDQDNIPAKIANSVTPNPGSAQQAYLRTVNTPFWPLNYRPFGNTQQADFVTFVDMNTYNWYVNINPTRA